MKLIPSPPPKKPPGLALTARGHYIDGYWKISWTKRKPVARRAKVEPIYPLWNWR